MAKFKLLHQLLLDQGLIERKQIHVPLSIARRDLEEIHPRRYHETFSRDQLTRPEQRRIGLPATSALVQRTWLAVGGTLLTARLAHTTPILTLGAAFAFLMTVLWPRRFFFDDVKSKEF